MLSMCMTCIGPPEPGPPMVPPSCKSPGVDRCRGTPGCRRPYTRPDRGCPYACPRRRPSRRSRARSGQSLADWSPSRHLKLNVLPALVAVPVAGADFAMPDARLALLRPMAMRCLFAALAPFFFAVFARIAGGLALISSKAFLVAALGGAGGNAMAGLPRNRRTLPAPTEDHHIHRRSRKR